LEILIVNPQPIWAQRIQARLEATGARVSSAGDWNSAAKLLEEAEDWPDILVIEHRTLEKESAPLLDAFRDEDWLPVVVPTDFQHLSQDPGQMSLRAEEELRILETLVVRLKGAFEPAAHQYVRVGRLTIDPARKEVVFAARRVPLPPIQFRLLLYMALNAGRVVEQRELVREIWGYTSSESEARQLISKHVSRIRRKLGWADDSTNYLQSVPGFGYMLSPPSRARGKRSPEEGSPPGALAGDAAPAVP
jgi:two-component system KDP operon response regulator KdpE